MNTNERQCPICQEILICASKKNAEKATIKGTPCRSCMYKVRKLPKDIACPLCDFTTKIRPAFDAHLSSIHNKTTQQLWNELNSGPVLCKCGCQRQTTWLGWSNGYAQVIIGHNGNLVAFHGEERAKEVSDKRKKSLKGQEGWSKGLTKETDERIRLRGEATSISRKKAFKEGSITLWSKGLTKETDERLARLAKKQAEKFADDTHIPWAKGLSKETDVRIQNMADKVSLTHQNKNLRARLDEFKRLKVDDIKARIEANENLEFVDFDGSYINDAQHNIKVRCKKCGHEFNDSLRKLQYGRCFICDPGGSRAQHEIANWIKNTLFQHVDSNRRDVLKGQELDIFSEQHKFAIEYNGLYWHNITQKSSHYHQNKTDKCSELGISLFHVFEDEWRDKRSIVESMIRHKLNKTENVVNARQCTVGEITVSERKEFFNENHVDGDTNSKIAFGLFDKADNIVSTFSLRAPFHKKHSDSLEVARFCNKINTNVRGGLSKLSKVAATYTKEQNYGSMLSYVDSRLGSTGSGWTNSNWKLTSETPPRFWWTDNENRFNRFKFKADKKNNLTEAQVAETANVLKIFGCKNLCFKFNV